MNRQVLALLTWCRVYKRCSKRMGAVHVLSIGGECYFIIMETSGGESLGKSMLKFAFAMLIFWEVILYVIRVFKRNYVPVARQDFLSMSNHLIMDRDNHFNR